VSDIEKLRRLFGKARKSAHKTGTDERTEFFVVFQEADYRAFRGILDALPATEPARERLGGFNCLTWEPEEEGVEREWGDIGAP
jgi:hypothetical protein